MSIKPLSILPRVGDVALPRSGGSTLQDRIILEMVQNENAKSLQNTKNVDDALTAFNTEIGKETFDYSTPVMEAASNAKAQLLGEYAQKIQGLGQNSQAIRMAQLEYQTKLNADPRIREGIRDKVIVDRYKSNLDKFGEHLDPDLVKNGWDLITKNRIGKDGQITRLNEADLDVTKMIVNPAAITDKMLKEMTRPNEEIDHKDGKSFVNVKNTLDPNAAQLIKDRIHSLRAWGTYDGDQQKAIDANIDRQVEIHKLSISGRKIESLTNDPIVKAEPNFVTDKLKDLSEGRPVSLGTVKDGTTMVPIDMRPTAGGKVEVFKKGESMGSVDEAWDQLSDEGRAVLTQLNMAPSKQYTTPSGASYADVKGYIKGRNGGSGVSMPLPENVYDPSKTNNTMDKGDAALLSRKGSYVEQKEGHIETNNPKVLESLGYTLTYDKEAKRYYLQDKQGKIYDETSGDANTDKGRQNTGVFAVGDKGADRSDKGHESGTQKIFKVKTEVTQNQSAAPIQQQDTGFHPTGDLQEDTRNFIKHGESRKDDYNAVNPRDNKWVSIGRYQFNTPENQDAIFKAGGQEDAWNAVKKELPNMTKDARKAKIQEIYNNMTDNEKRAFESKQEDIADQKYFKPLQDQFDKDKTAVPDALQPLLRDMAIQHTNGMLGDTKSLYNDVQALIKKSPTDKEGLKQLAKDISDVRSKYVQKLELSDSVKKEILDRRIPDAYSMTLAMIEGKDAPASASPTPQPTPPTPAPAPPKPSGANPAPQPKPTPNPAPTPTPAKPIPVPDSGTKATPPPSGNTPKGASYKMQDGDGNKKLTREGVISLIKNNIDAIKKGAINIQVSNDPEIQGYLDEAMGVKKEKNVLAFPDKKKVQRQ